MTETGTREAQSEFTQTENSHMIGQILGYYQITEKIGEGGMCMVYKAVDLMQRRDVALKVIRPEFAREQPIVDRFCVEAVTLAKLNHPNVASVYGFFRQGEDFFIAMEFVAGETLEHVLSQNGAMPWKQAVPLFCHVLDGIEHAHQLEIIHRDIKPGNIMLTESGVIKVMDFGIARLPGSSRLTKDGSIIGTPAYMSPEQIRGREMDTRSDIYSLGMLLYELLTGRLPFVSSSDYELMRSHIEDTPLPLRDAVPDLPPLIETAIMRALMKKPEERFRTAREFRAVLDHGLIPAETGSRQVSEFALASGKGEIWQDHPPEVMLETGETDLSYLDTLPDTKETETESTDPTQPTGENPTTTPSVRPTITQPPPSRRTNLTWKHRVAGSAVLLILVGVVAGLINIMVSAVELPTAPPLPLSAPATTKQTHQSPEPPQGTMKALAKGRNPQRKKKADQAGDIINKVGNKVGNGVKKMGRVFKGGN